MTILSTLTQQSGSVGETVFSRNQHGPYTRDRTVPADPSSARQVVVRAALTECVDAWKNVLTATERRSWDSFALAVRVRTALGRSTNAGGLAMYIRANVPRIQAGVGAVPRVDQAPTILTSPSMESLTLAILNVVDDTCLVYVPPDQSWLNQPGGALLFYASPPRPLTVNFYRGPYKLAGTLAGQPLGPSYTPFIFSLPLPAAVNQRVFVRARQVRADARIGPSIYLQADHVPQIAPTLVSSKFVLGPPRRVEMLFSEIIRDEPHDVANWSVVFAARRWTVSSVQGTFNPTTLLTLLFSGSVSTFEPQRLIFTPPPDDVNGINTGIPVAAFNVPLTP